MSQFSNQGVVSEVSTKEWYDSRKGRNIDLFSFRIEGNNNWFRTGTNRPNFNQGDAISFTNDDKNNVRLDSVQAGNAPAPTQNSAPQGGAGSPTTSQPSGNTSGGQNREGYWAAKEARDLEKDARYQNVDVPRMGLSAAQDRAVALVVGSIGTEAIPFGNMNKGERLDYLIDCVEKVTDRFVLDTNYAPERLKGLLEEAANPAENVSESKEETHDYAE